MGMARQHIPYRNSMMTTVLRDSLGGNCRTVMVATITAEHSQLDESISTCRFAQRVAMVSNEVSFRTAVSLVAAAICVLLVGCAAVTDVQLLQQFLVN